jgi:RNA polymerase sigma factor (sigma-70 family)
VEASALPASVGLGRSRIAIGASLLRIRSDEQLVTFFREGNDDAFRVIHDRYRPRLCAYTRQMLAGTGQDAEDAVQEIFTRAYYGLRADNRELALRAWLYRIAHNLCIDELRRPHATPVEAIEALVPNFQDPVARAEQRDALRRLIADVQRLPDQQRSALMMRELSGMTYADVSGALGVSIPAVKSLLVRARVNLAQASEARDTACAHIREDLILSHDRGVRTSGVARRHMRDCSDCRRFRSEVRGVNRSLASLAPTLGPLGVIANLLGLGGGGGAAAGGGAAGGGAAAGAAGTGTVASTGLLAGGATHVVTLLAAAVVTAGGAVELHNTLAAPHHRAHHHAPAIVRKVSPARARTAPANGVAGVSSTTQAGSSTPRTAPTANQIAASREGDGPSASSRAAAGTTASQPLTMTLDPDNLQYVDTTMPGSTPTPNQTAAAREGDGASPSSPATATGADGTTSPGATATGGPVSTSTGSTATSSPTGATTSPSSSSSGSTSGTSSSTATPAAAGGAASTNGSATTASSAPSSSSTASSASTSSSGDATSRSAASKSVGSSAASTNSSKVLNFMTTKHRPRHKILVGRLL